MGIPGRIARYFQDSQLTPLLALVALLAGLFAVWVTPREEEPQIRVPMVDVTVAWPGAEPAEVESRLVTPIERVLLEADFGVKATIELTQAMEEQVRRGTLKTENDLRRELTERIAGLLEADGLVRAGWL